MKLHRSAAVAAALTGALCLPAVAAAAEPTRVDGNPNCSSLGSGLRQLKVEPVRSGTYEQGALSVTLKVSGASVAFTTAGEGVDAVIVKGGPNANVYLFSPEVTSGSGLTAPQNPNSGQPYGLSHVSFCYDTNGAPPKGKDGGQKGGGQKGGGQKGGGQKGGGQKGGGQKGGGQKGGGQKGGGQKGGDCKKSSKKCRPQVTQGRMTGHGHEFDAAGFDKVQWEFRNSVCNADRFPDLKVEYGTNKFVLTDYSSPLQCLDTGASEGRPVAGFDTIDGQGTGTLNGMEGATIKFRFTDAGEPGRSDTAQFTITAPDGSISIAYVGGAFDGGNHQAHRR